MPKTAKTLITVFTLLFCFSAVAEAKTEKLTSSITWEITTEGTLLIQGVGEMPDFKFDKPRYWRKKEYEGKINKIVISEGITAVGSYNFDNGSLFNGNSFTTVHSVELPSTLTEIRLGAFTGNQIRSLTLPENLRVIGVGAFKNSRVLKNITITSRELSIYSGALEDCRELEEVDFNNARVMLFRLAFAGDKALASVRNASNVSLSAGLSLTDVFKNAPLKSLDETKEAKTDISSPASSPVPDGEWDIEYADGGQVYAGEYVRLNFNGTMPSVKLDNGIDAPFGYMSSWDDSGGSSFFKFSKPEITGDKVKVSCTGYVDDGEEKSNLSKNYFITYNKESNSITLHDAENRDEPMEFLDFNRIRIPENVFGTEYTGTISYEDRGEDIISVHLYRNGEKVVMETIVLHPFMTPPTIVSFYAGTIDGHEIKFNRKIENLVYNLQDENALDPPLPTWEEINSSGTPCDNTITHYTSFLYLDNIILEP